jgi:hypothetical protein
MLLNMFRWLNRALLTLLDTFRWKNTVLTLLNMFRWCNRALAQPLPVWISCSDQKMAKFCFRR